MLHIRGLKEYVLLRCEPTNAHTAKIKFYLCRVHSPTNALLLI